MMPCGLLNAGERAEVVAITRGNCGRMEDMGIRAGKILEMLQNGGRGPVLVKVDETRIAMGRGMAMHILVRRVS